MIEEKKQAEIDYIIRLQQEATPERVHKMFISATNICKG